MYSATIKLTQTDPTDATPMLSIAAYITSAAAIPASGGTQGVKKLSGVLWFRVYAEDANNDDASNGSARLGFNQKTSRIAATSHGQKLLPGLEPRMYYAAGISGQYDFNNAYIVGATGDRFQIEWGTL